MQESKKIGGIKMEGIRIIGLCLLKMGWLWGPPMVILTIYCINEELHYRKERKRSRNRSEDNYLK